MIRQRNPGQYGVTAEMRIQMGEFVDKIIVPYTVAPVFVANGDSPVLARMKFSLVPSWSKEPKVKFATHNARLESINEKPTWKTVFRERHCLVPLTDFIEPIYEGKYAGNMIAFHNPSGKILYAAGVWDEWVDKSSGEVIQSFAIVTFDPPPFVAGIGHDRCPLFLSEDDGGEWLNNNGESGEMLKDFLLNHNAVPDLDVTAHRPLKAGWEKRR